MSLLCIRIGRFRKNGSSVRSLMFARGISRMVLLPTPTMLPYMAICSRWRSIWFRPGKKQNVVDFIQTRGMACSVYGSQFLMDALYEANDAEYALHMLTKTDDRSWYNMIRVGSTISLEAWDNKYKPNQDWNHAWGAAPANIIPRRLMGVEPLTPGFGTARIKPQLASLEWAEGNDSDDPGERSVWRWRIRRTPIFVKADDSCQYGCRSVSPAPVRQIHRDE